ncbi:transcriptional regulator [Bacillus sp. M6-12]|uniref:sigma-54 interaction domain-containing protein n=1 Tax=Bacillus sp. M6-12 TaxID=2054166 RepID=UPI000C7675AF|nr:sigma 54-interacting transcriptional regulator [Bacillus sp. M6-12]PLS14600.1 transcriptional regulator [Bacillus sp. M6-12]
MKNQNEDYLRLIKESHIKKFIDYIDMACILFDLEGTVVHQNRMVAKLVNPKDVWKLLTIEQRDLSKSKEFEFDTRINDENYNIEIRKFYLKKFEFLYVVLQKKEYKLQQTQLNDELQFIIDATQEGIYITDEKGFTLKINDAYSKMTNIAKKEVEGKHVSELIAMQYFDSSITLKVIKYKQKVSILQKIKDKEDIWLVSGKPVLNKQNKMTLIVNTVYDMTKLNHLQESLKMQAISIKRQDEEIERLRSQINEIPGLIAQSPSMRPVLYRIKRLSMVDTSVLILGETGTGKNVVAEKIHSLSKRNGRPFIEVNCGAIPEPLFESELFGYTDGSFTGAKSKGKKGLIEAANGGTLFLDEIAEIPMNLQVKLLSVLQNKRIRKIGDIDDKKIDIRIIAATNKDPIKLIEQKEIREDLYYRLSVVPLNIPPLKNRKEDIHILIKHFIERFNNKHQKEVQFSNSVNNILESYHWPGNIRELEHLVEQLIVLSDKNLVEVYDLPQNLQMIHPQNNNFDYKSTKLSLKDAIEDLERNYILYLWKEHKDIYKISDILNIHRTTLLRKAEKLNIDLK